jgi:hypothetical protein
MIEDPFRSKKKMQYDNTKPMEVVKKPEPQSQVPKGKFMSGFGSSRGVTDNRPKKVKFRFS